MVNISTLKKSIYKADYFSEQANLLTIQNEKDPAEGVLSFVEMSSSGTFISLDNKILKEGCDIFQSEDRANGRISFRRDCDGVCILDINGRKLLLFIEVKSGFNEVKKKAFEQLVASYIKTRSILQSIEGYNPSDYEELALLFSYPPSGATTVSTSGILSTKSAVIASSSLDKLNTKNATALSVDQEVYLNLNDYNVNACHVNPALYNTILHVKHIPVTNLAVSGTIDIDQYI